MDERGHRDDRDRQRGTDLIAQGQRGDSDTGVGVRGDGGGGVRGVVRRLRLSLCLWWCLWPGLQIRIGGDQALFRLLNKLILETEGAVDQPFIDEHTHGYEEFA
ncbi:hypothetical protein, partial [Streptomyces sp. Agncl-13]|uniref:hypothetical protein n=1 Tax=Streptomyces sp. Agncl-13 TaxID=3400628 RepID=UPI003A83FCFB